MSDWSEGLLGGADKAKSIMGPVGGGDPYTAAAKALMAGGGSSATSSATSRADFNSSGWTVATGASKSAASIMPDWMMAALLGLGLVAVIRFTR